MRRSERGVALALLALLAADLRAVGHLRSACARGPLAQVRGLDAAISLRPGLRPGDDVPGTAVLSNVGPTTVTVRDVAAVLVATATSTPLTWAGGNGLRQQIVLSPRSVARVDFVLHTARCRGRESRLRPGFYEVTLALRTDHGTVRAGVRAVVMASR